MYHLVLLLGLALLAAGCADSHDNTHDLIRDEPMSAKGMAYASGLESHDLDIRSSLEYYLRIHERLVDDDLDGAREASERLARVLSEMAVDAVDHGPRLEKTSLHADSLAHAVTLHEAREYFGEVNAEFVPLVAAANSHEFPSLYRLVCGMTDSPEKGSWLQRDDEVRNPYYGSAMLRCASSVEPVYAPVSG
jgi:hypothetical protein